MLLINFLLVVSLATSSVYGASAQSSYKARRGGTVGLFPFPRVGRSQMGHSWQVSPLELGDFHNGVKRQGLIPFPRVGRSDPGLASMGEPGMWFGPRLGRVSRRLPYFDENTWAMYALRDLPQHEFAARPGRDQEETPDENDLEQPEIDTEISRSV